MKKVGETKIGKLTPKPHITYPLIRLPPEFADVIGKKAQIFETEYQGNRAFLIVVGDSVIKPDDSSDLEKRVSKLEIQVKELYNAIFGESRADNAVNWGKNKWARRDSNPRPSGYEPDALTWLSYGPL